jgi:hypothetical protein
MEEAHWGTKRRRSDFEPSACHDQPRKGGAWTKIDPAVTQYRSVEERLKAANAKLKLQLESYRAAATAENAKVVTENSQLLAALIRQQETKHLQKPRSGISAGKTSCSQLHRQENSQSNKCEAETWRE